MKRPTSTRSFRAKSPIARIVVAVLAGALAGAAAVLAAVAWRISLVAGGHADASARIALVTPLGSALAAGLLAIGLLYRFRVSDRDTLIGVAIAAAAPAFALGHLSRLFDPALALAAGGEGRFSLLFWLHGCEWLASARATEVVSGAPGLRPVSDAVGAEACAALAMCELLLISGLLLAAVDRALDAPLCIGCRRWCRRQTAALRRSAAVPPAVVVERASARDWHFFRNLGPPRGRASLRVDLAACPTCDRMSSVSIALIRPLRSELSLVRDLRLGPDDLRTVRDLVAAARPAPTASPRPLDPVFAPRSGAAGRPV